jgi:hypothetical protein
MYAVIPILVDLRAHAYLELEEKIDRNGPNQNPEPLQFIQTV